MIDSSMRQDFARHVMPATRAAIAGLVAETDQKTKDTARFAFLQDRFAALTMRLWDLSDRHEDYGRQRKMLERLLTGERIQTTAGEIVKTYRAIRQIGERMTGKASPRADRITNEDIDRAREYPIDELIAFDRAGMALCPFHEDRTPSMHRHGNRAYCFSCGRGWGPVDVLMEKDGMTFPEAVRRLL